MAAKNEAKIRFSAETKDFDKGIKDANSTLTTLRNELKLNEAQMRNNGVSVDGLKEKQQNLAAQMDAAQDKTKALSDKLAVAVEVFGENSTEANKLRNQLINAQTAEVKLQGAIDRCNAELDRQEAAANRVQSESEKLSDTISDQEKELDKLKRAYADYVISGDDASDEARELAREIDELSGDLRENRNRMDDANRAADELDRSLDDAEESADNAAGGGFTVLKGALADLVSEGIQAVISGLGDLFSYFGQLPQETAEIRQDMGTLVTAFDDVGFSSETATDTWKELYKVFGEDDRAVETANNIARIAKNEKDLNEWITITTGVWGKYQDSLPVEGLAESAAETAKVGTVTGNLADALNWGAAEGETFGLKLKENIEFTELSAKELGKLTDSEKADYEAKKAQYDAIAEYNSILTDSTSAEEIFNLALAECTTEQERQTLITDTLAKMYGGAADKYRDSTSAQMEAKEAAAEQIIAENELAAAIEPVTTAWQGMKNELLVGILPAVEAVSGAMTDALAWMKEHPVAVQAIAAALGVFGVALGALAIAVGVYTVAQWAMNAAVLANPITWIVVAIVAAIAALVAIGVVLYNNWDTIKAKASEVWAGIKEKFGAIKDTISEVWNNAKAKTLEVWENIRSGISNAITTAKTTVANVVNGIKTTVANVFNGIKSTAVSVWNSVKTAITTPINAARDAVKTAIEKIKGFFKFDWSLPKLKLPSISIKGKFSLDPPSVPKFSIDWFKDGGIMTNPTIFGINGNRLMAGGEAGPEAILPIDRLQGYISSAIDKTMQTVNINALVAAVEDLANRPIQMNVNGRQFAVATAADTDSVNGNRLALSKRGLAL